jgi:predicted transposase YdaD
MEQLPTPHNNFFHYALSHMPSARSFIETQLSPRAVAELDMETLRLEQTSFIDADLREKYSDLLFSVQLAKPTSPPGGNADEALVYVLFEHKSQSDPLTVLQVLAYMIRIWEKRARHGLPPCPIVPLIVYHGESGWTAARSLAELIAAPDGLAEYQISFMPVLLDLLQLPDDKIQGAPVLRSTLELLKYSRSRQLVDRLRGILQSIVQSLPENLLPDWIDVIGAYVMAVNKNLDSQQYKQTLSSVLPTQYEPGSLADRLLTQGREEGREEGKLSGKIQILQELLGEPVASDSELRELNVDALNTQLANLQQRLRDRPA